MSAGLARIRHMARPIDPTERAHLLDETGYTPPIHRYAPSPALADVVRRFWMPVWSLPPGVRSVQRVLQYPVCLVVVAHDYALLVGPTSGLSTQQLTGSGWAVGTMLQPAVGAALAGGSVDRLTDTAVALDAEIERAVRAAIGGEPDDPARRDAAVAALEERFADLLPVDEEGLLVNAIVEHVEGDSSLQRVAQICEKFAIGERSLQRLTKSRIGLSPKWLVQRRRLHEAAERLRADDRPDLARVAAELGYSDQCRVPGSVEALN